MHAKRSRCLFLILFLASSGARADEQTVVGIFTQARIMAAEMISSLESADLVFPQNQVEEEKQLVREFFRDHRSDLIEDIHLSEHIWVHRDGPCGQTGRSRNANIIFSFERCDEESETYLIASRFLIGESVHHFDRGDAFTDWVKEAIVQGFREKNPSRYDEINVRVLRQDEEVDERESQLFGRIGYREAEEIFLGIDHDGKILMSTRPGGYFEGQERDSGIFRLNLEQSKIMGAHTNENRNFGCSEPVEKVGNKFVGRCDMFFAGSIRRYEPRVGKVLTVDHYMACKFHYFVEIEPLYDSDAINVVIRKPLWLDGRTRFNYDDPRSTCRQSEEMVTEAAWFPLPFD